MTLNIDDEQLKHSNACDKFIILSQLRFLHSFNVFTGFGIHSDEFTFVYK